METCCYVYAILCDVVWVVSMTLASVVTVLSAYIPKCTRKLWRFSFHSWHAVLCSSRHFTYHSSFSAGTILLSLRHFQHLDSPPKLSLTTLPPLPPILYCLSMGGTRRRRDKRSKEPEKRGNPGIFQGGPLTVLESWATEYVSTRGNRGPFWARFFGAWRTQYTPLTPAEQEMLDEVRKRCNIKPAKVDLPAEDDSCLFVPDSEPIAGPLPAADRAKAGVTSEEPNGPDNSAVSGSGTPVTERSDQNTSDTSATAIPVTEHSDKDMPEASTMAAPVVDGSNQDTSSATATLPVTESSDNPTSTSTPTPVAECPDNTAPVIDEDCNICHQSSSNSDSTTSDVVDAVHAIITTTSQPSLQTTTSSHSSDVPGPAIDRAPTPVPGTKKQKKKKNQRTEADNILIARGATDERLKMWFSTRAIKDKAAANQDEAWTGLIKHLNKDQGPAPRHVPDFKVYQGQDEFKEKIANRLTELYGDDDDETYHLAHSVDIASKLFAQEDDATKEKVHERAEAVYEARCEDYEKQVRGEHITKAEHIPILRSQMGAKLQSLVDTIARATDTCCSFVSAGYNKGTDDNAFFCNILSGTTPGPNPKKFNEWDPVGWKMHHVLSFAEYVKACARLEQGYPATPPQYPPELVSACAESADIINPMVEAVGETTVPAPTSLPTTSNPTMMAASLSSSSSSAQPRKRTRRNSDSGDNTPHSPTPELLSDNDQNIPDDSVDYGECGIKLAPGRRMGKYLALELKEMSRQERTKKVLVYSKYTQKDLHKEEQAAKKRFIDDLMNEDSEEEEEEELPTPRGKGKGKAKPKQKARGKGKGKRKHKSMRRDDEDDDEDRDLELDNRGHNAKRQRVERPTVRNEELSHTTPINPGLCTPPSSQYPRIATTPDAEAGARCTATGDGSAQASASALISTSGDADVYATARSIRGATSTACATVRGSGQQADSATSANISVDTQSAPPSPAKASSEPQASAPSSSSALPHEDNSRPGFSGGSSPTLPPPSPSPVKPRSSARSSAPHSLARSSTQPSRSQPPISSASSSSVSSGGRPSWVQQMKDYLASNITGDEWLQCIESWEDMEHEYGFVTTLQSLPTKTRPDAVLFWTKRARKGPTPPDVKQPGFGAAVTDWWNSMMPSWRTRDGHGRWERTGEGNWGALCCPGLNGLLSVLACLRWWLIEECGGLDGSVSHASTEWQAVFNDICWVMEELTKNEGAPVRKKPKSD
ncbi:SERTA domain-containing protein 3 [Paramarasmius palmivorus]|uniref:SERTA domain-containing protein 3 n=1 Tax=Paramarasmius palmivorus TaxID=297713 RepID=A0AAW0D6D8_9AGAR